MSRKKITALAPAAAIVCLVLCTTASAAETVLDPIADTWIRQFLPDGVYDADFLTVWSPGTSPGEDGDNARHGVLSFDLTSITKPIASARLELYMVDYWRNPAYPKNQAAYLVTPAVTSDNSLSWSSYYAANPLETQLEGLGVYELPTGCAVNQTYTSTATAADVALLEALRTGGGTATFVLKAQQLVAETTEIQGRHDWGDLETPGQAPTITINGLQIAASADTWVREISPTTVFESDDISVWHSERTGAGQRVGILEFDLSGIASEITEASMSLFSLNSGAAGEVFVQNAKLLGLSSAPMTWNDYVAAGSSLFEDFGHYSLAADAPVNAYIDSDAASAVDLAMLESARLNGGKLIVALESVPQEVTHTVYTATSCDWADSESTYTGYGNLPPASNPQIWPRLIIEEVPEPSTIVLLVLGMVTLFAARRR